MGISSMAGVQQDVDRFKWESKNAGDFPFYKAARDAKLSFWLKLALLAAVIAATLLLVDVRQAEVLDAWQSLGLPSWVGGVLVILAFPGIIFGAGWLLFQQEMRGLFRTLKKGTFKIVILCMLGYLAYSTVVSFLLNALGIHTQGDIALPEGNSAHERVVESLNVLIQAPFQLFGEELFALLSFLIFLSIGYGLFKLQRKPAIIVALLASCVVFGLAHYKAYDWHLAQMLLIIGASRLFMTFAYLKTKNILVSFFVHFGFDGGIAFLTLLLGLAGLAAGK